MASRLGLPRFVFFFIPPFSSYLCQTNNHVAGSLRSISWDVTSPANKFEMEMAKTDDGDGGPLYNIRSCHNNKYWMAESPDSLYMTAAADKPNEDSSQWSCTLFEAVPVEPQGSNNNLIIQLRFVYNQKIVSAVDASPDHLNSLYPNDNHELFSKLTVINAESFVMLPNTVVFKASNGKYLQPSPGRITACATDIGDPDIAFVTYYCDPFGGGCASFKLKDNHQGLCFTDDAVMTRDHPPYLSDFFKPIKVAGPKFEDGKVVSSTTIGLRCRVNNQFLRYDNARGDNVYADAPSIVHEAVFTVEEPVMSRNIYNVRFHLADSRIYDETIVTLVNQEASNSSSETDVQHLKLNYVKKSSSTFDRSVSLYVGVETTFTTGIPFIAEGQITVSSEWKGSMGWSDTTEESQEVESSQVVEVPPMTIVTVSVVATNGKCDVPFSYTQSDMLFDGTEVITEMNDGIYRGVNSWNFHYVTTSKPLAL